MKSKPIRWMIVIGGTLFSGILSLFYLKLVSLGAEMSEEEQERWRILLKSMLFFSLKRAGAK
jgi:hypothetical protein